MRYIDAGKDELDSAIDTFVDALIDDLDAFAMSTHRRNRWLARRASMRARWRPPTRRPDNRNFGNCTPEQHRRLQAPVHVLCDIKARGRTCTEGMTGCNNLNKRILRNMRCIEARNRINQTCYGGSDADHRIAENDARRALANCQDFWRRQRCMQRPDNRRIPRAFG